LQEIGAGLQLSPNATRILGRFGVLSEMERAVVRPDCVTLRSASTLKELAHVPLGQFADRRWGAPYLVAHRADLQSALLSAVARQPAISLITGATVAAGRGHGSDTAVYVETAPGRQTVAAPLIVAADGVRSKLRATGADAKFAGSIAWRKTFHGDDPTVRFVRMDAVNAFLHPGCHVIAYPIRCGTEVNIVAFTAGQTTVRDWSSTPDLAPLHSALAGMAAPLSALADDQSAWTAWPVYTAPDVGSWVQNTGVVAIGDAAHAMTPFAAQGAAMAIEDAYTLAEEASGSPTVLAENLTRWEVARRSRVKRVADRGAFNRFVWHASGPTAWARDIALKLRSPERLAADLDWLYGWRPGDLS
jgi:salicylate hydroxylase